jgi:hypothetical protein
MAPAQHLEPERSVYLGEVAGAEPFRLALAEAHSHDAFSRFHIVLQRHGVTFDPGARGELRQAFPGIAVHQRRRVQHESRAEKRGPAAHVLELPAKQAAHLRAGRGRKRSTGAAPELVELADRAPDPTLVGVNGFTGEDRVGECVERQLAQLRRDLAFQHLGHGLQLEAEVGQYP